jgi:ABC-type branched-subunit amino acid transport system substrate-binding protein
VLALVLITLFVAGCGSSKKATSQTDSVQLKPIIQKDTSATALPDTTIPQARPMVDTFDIALILPFYLDSVGEIPDSVEVNYYDESKLAIEFYNGVMMALEELSRDKLKARIHIYDDANDKERINRIAQLADFKDMELIIGPVYNNNLRIMAEYAKHDSIYLVSPLSPAANITSYNPFYIMVNPSIEAHCRKIFDYIVANHHDDNILLFTRPGSTEETYAAIFQKYLTQYQTETNDYSLQITQVTFAPAYGKDDEEVSEKDITAFFDDSVKNVVIVPSVEKSYMHSVGRTLYPMVEPPNDIKDPVEYDITVMGLPVWGEQEGTRFDYAHSLDVHFTSSYFIDPGFYDKGKNFYNRYLNAYHNEPSEYAIKGYDLMLYFGNLLDKHNIGFDTMMCKETARGIHTDFSFGIHYAPPSPFASIDSMHALRSTDYIENKYVHLLKYEDYSVVKVK